ncbi:MAG TPA: hypothetical protein VNA25_30080 [Phycisphaerae bacterium]|nr:hypothetical protein [Phycisphaerae bacterium]
MKKYLNRYVVFALLAVAVFCVGAGRTWDTRFYKIANLLTDQVTVLTSITNAGDSAVTGDATVGGTLGVTGVTTLTTNTTVGGTLAVTGAAGLNGGLTVVGATLLEDFVSTAATLNETVFTAGTVSLTSPTATFSVNGLSNITLNSDANMTALLPIGAVEGQMITLVAGAGSNTMQFDDSTSVTCGGNIVLTEGQGDVMVLLCTTAPNAWVRISNVDN